MLKLVWLVGMAVTAVLITIGLLVFNRKPIKEDLVVIALWPYFLCYAVSFISIGLYKLARYKKKI